MPKVLNIESELIKMAEIKKVTKKEALSHILEIMSEDKIAVEYCNNELELLAKKAGAKSSSKQAKENAELKEILIAELTKIGKPITITDLMNQNEVIKGYTLENGSPISNQKISALFKIMIDSDKTIVKVTDKKKSYFSVAE